MATELTVKAQIKADGPTQEPQLVLEIDGVSTVYGIGTVKKYVKIGDPGLVIGDAWKIGGLGPLADQLDVIDLSGSSNSISQQLLQDKGGTSSIPSIQISLIDKNGELTKLITPGEVVEDILGRKANVYLGYKETAFPQDFVRIFSGVIDEVQGGSTIILNVAHPEQKKRAEIFPQISTELTANLRYRSATIQGLRYQTRRDVVGTVSIEYVSGGTAGSEVVSVSGNNITVQIEPSVSQARHIRNAIENSVEALSLVEVRIETGQTNTLQIVQAPVSLDSDTVVEVVSTAGMLLPSPANGFRTYVRIQDEVIEYTGLTPTQITGITRGAFSLIDERAEAAPHAEGESVQTFYRLQGSAIEIALRVLMSGGPANFSENVPIKSIVEVEGVGNIPNAVWFDGINVQDAYGLTIGDGVSITGDPIGSNNTSALIQDIVATPFGSYVILDGAGLTLSVSTPAVAAFSSKWNVLPDGLGLGGDEVDVPEFERIRDVFSSSIFTYDFYLKETLTGKDFIDTEVLFPTGAFTLPRRGKISVGYTSPPLAISGLKILDSTNTTKPNQTRVKRSITRNFYNNILFRYNEAVVDERRLSGDLEVQQDSKNRIPVGNRTLVIDARGLRPSTDTATIIEVLKKRFGDKYKYGAESITMFAFYGKTFNTDVGDVVVYGDPGLKLPDTKKGTRDFAPRLFEVSNKNLSIKTGEVKLELIDSGYSLEDGRYGVVSPSSLTLSGTLGQSELKIKNSFDTVAPRVERTKWTPYIGQKILIHDELWDNLFTTRLLGFSPSDDFLMLLEDALPFNVTEDFIVDVAQYPDNEDEEDSPLLKRVFVYTNPTVEVATGISSTQFTVALADADKFKVGAIVLVRGDGDEKWDTVSPEVHVSNVTGTTITVDESLGFTPSAGFEVDLIGFKDEGAPYRYL